MSSCYQGTGTSHALAKIAAGDDLGFEARSLERSASLLSDGNLTAHEQAWTKLPGSTARTLALAAIAAERERRGTASA